MAPSKSAKASSSQTAQNALRSESTSLDASQEADNQYWAEKLRSRSKRSTERKAQRKREVVARHNQRMGKVNSKISGRVEKHNERVRTIRRSKVQYLVKLVQKKRELEEMINKCKAELEQPFLSMAKQLQVALEGRINELS